MVNCAEKAQHLWRCFTHNIPYPRVACTIVWQPWAIKSATPTALKHAFCNTISVVSCDKTRQIIVQRVANHYSFNYQQRHHP